MAEGFDSIQAVLRRRRGAAFVGRGAQLALFRDNFSLPVTDSRKAYIFNVHGEGGIGKSTLLGQWRQIAQEHGAVAAQVDEQIFGVPEAMSALVEQLNAPSEAKDFRARYAEYLKSRERLESDPEAPRELWSQVIRTGVKVGLHASKALPGVAPVVELVDAESTADAVDRVRQFLVRKVRDSKEARLLLSPAQELSPLFVTALARIAGTRPVVLFFDTFEETAAILEDWLYEVLVGEYGDLPTSITMVIAGRLPLDPNRWSDLLGLVAPVPLSPFTEAEMRQFLTAQGVTDRQTADAIMAISGGLPLLTDMLAKSRPANADAVGDPADTAVERFLKWESDPTRRRAALAGALSRQIDEDLLAAVLEEPDATALFEWLTDQAFVRLHTDRYRYHDVVRSQMIRWQRQRSPQRWRSDHLRLADVYRARRDLVGTDPSWADTAWLDNHIELTYHQLCGLRISRQSALRDAANAVSAGMPVARRWVEMIVEAGRDADDPETHAIGLKLVEAATGEESDGTNILTVLLDSGTLNAAGRAALLLERARQHYFADRDEEAVRDCTEVIQHSPTQAKDQAQAKAYAVRGAATAFLGQHEDALVDFEESLRIDPDDVWTIYRRGRTYLWMGRYDQAIADFNRVLELEPAAKLVFADRGDTYRLMERYEEALADLSRAIELNPTDTRALASRAETYLSMERYDEALADLHRAIELDPEFGWALGSRAHVYRLMGRYEEALADFDRVLELDPTYGWALGSRGQTYQSMERYAEALADFDRAIELDQLYYWVIAQRGETYRLMERYEEALADFDRAIELSPTYGWAFASRAEAYQSMGRYEEALADLTRVIDLDPTDDWAFGHRGDIYRLTGRYEEALADLDRAIALDETDGDYRVVRGKVYRAMGLTAEASADFQRASQLGATLQWNDEDGPVFDEPRQADASTVDPVFDDRREATDH